GVFPFIFHVTASTGGSVLATFGVGIFETHVPVPFVSQHRNHLAMFGHGVGFPVVVVHAAVAGGTGFRFARFRCREFMTGVAVVAFVLVGVTHGSAFSHFALRHRCTYCGFDVGCVVQGV